MREALLRLNRGPLEIGPWPSERAATLFNATLIVAWGVFTAAILVQTGHFTYDQAYFYELSVRFAETLRLPAYGPFVSGTDPSSLTPGGLLYVVYSVPFFFFRDPRAGVVWIHILAAVGAWLFDRAMKTLGVPPAARVATLGLYIASMAHARALETFWNGDLFLFITPVLLYLAARMISDPQPLWPYAVFGVVGALSLQTHLSGGMGILMCLSMVWVLRPNALALRRVGVLVGTLFACYLPYLVHEAANGFPNTRLLRKAAPRAGFAAEPIIRSLVSPAMYVSHTEAPAQLLSFSGDWVQWAAVWSGWAAAGFCMLGLWVRHPLKLWNLLVLVGLPVYFLLNGRPYYDHYVVTVVPFMCLLAGAGLGWLLSRPWPVRAAALGYWIVYATVGAAILLELLKRPVLGPHNPWRGMTVSFQMDRARKAMAYGQPIPSGRMDELGFVTAVMAKRMYGHELPWWVGGRICTMDVRLSGFGPGIVEGPNVLPLAPNSVFVCK